MGADDRLAVLAVSTIQRDHKRESLTLSVQLDLPRLAASKPVKSSDLST